MSPEALPLYAYGVYLANGGNPDDFDKFTQDDMQVLLAVHSGERKRSFDILFKMFKGLAGVKD